MPFHAFDHDHHEECCMNTTTLCDQIFQNSATLAKITSLGQFSEGLYYSVWKIF